MDTYETTIGLGVLNEDVELKAQVHYDYEEGQPLITHPIEHAQEGIPESICIYSVMVEPLTDTQPVDIYYLLTEEMFESLDEDILRYIQIQQENRACP